MATGSSGSGGSGAGKSGGGSGAAGAPPQARRPTWRDLSPYAPLNEEHRAARAAVQLMGEFRAAKQEASKPPPPGRAPGRELEQLHGLTDVRAGQSLRIATTPTTRGLAPEPEPATIASDWSIRDAHMRQQLRQQLLIERLGAYRAVTIPPAASSQSIEPGQPGELRVTHAVHEQTNTSGKVSLQSLNVSAQSATSAPPQQLDPVMATPSQAQAQFVPADRTEKAVSKNVKESAEAALTLSERIDRRFAYHSPTIAQKIADKAKDKQDFGME